MAFTLQGVPSLLNAINYPSHIGITLKGISSFFKEPPVWGIFKDGKPIIVADGMTTLEYHDESSICNAPQEEGQLISYNKVKVPYSARVKLIRGGDETDRTIFLASLERVKNSLDLCIVVTPDRQYKNANIVSFDIRRAPESGYQLIEAEIVLQEVRFAGKTAEKKTPTDANGADKKSTGQIEGKKI